DARPTDNAFPAFDPFGHYPADSDRNHRAEVTNHGQLIILWPAPMDVAVAPTHWALARAEISARNIQKRFAECRSSSLVANQWREDIVFCQKQTARHANRLLTFAAVHAASDQAASIEAD